MATVAASTYQSPTNLFLTQSASCNHTARSYQVLPASEKIDIVKKKKKKELIMKLKRLWDEEQSKRGYSSKIKKKLNKAEAIEKKCLDSKVIKAKTHIEVVERNMEKKREIEEKRLHDNMKLMEDQQNDIAYRLQKTKKMQEERSEYLKSKELEFANKLQRIRSQRDAVNKLEDEAVLQKLKLITEQSISVI